MIFNFTKYRGLFYGLSVLLVGSSLFAIIFFGLNFGIDFKGGALLRVEFESLRPPSGILRSSLEEIGLTEFSLQEVSTNQVFIKAKEMSEPQKQLIFEKFSELGEIKKDSQSFEQIGPAVGRELAGKTSKVIFFCLACILLYIALSFRKLKKPVRSWIYGLAGLLALAHDVLIPFGIFAALGKFYGVEITIPIITAFLTVFGYSINDTVVVFDRIRENLFKSRQEDFDGIVNESLNQSLRRSFHTSLTTMLALFALFFFGGETLRYFALALILGVGLGTYSSLFIASPLVATYFKARQKKRLD